MYLHWRGFQKGEGLSLPENDESLPVPRSRIETLKRINTMIAGAGADEHSEIVQKDHAITPGGKDEFQHLLGTCYIAPEVAQDYALLLTNSYAGGAVDIKGLHTSKMDYAGKMIVSKMQISNSIDGRNQQVKAKMYGGVSTMRRAAGRFFRRGKGYEGDQDA